ncbi:hypothetical protein PSCICG_15420 [Pseudomonas cichorii]|nr:hypothetical protein PSCICG_15420 [Pseudomonas cichorii]
MLQLHKRQHVPASSFLDFCAGKWSPIERPGRAQATLERVRNGRKRFGDQFIMPYYGKGSGLTGRCTERPIGTITTLDRWALVRGDEMRMLSANEALAAQTFPAETLRPDNHRSSSSSSLTHSPGAPRQGIPMTERIPIKTEAELCAAFIQSMNKQAGWTC